MDPPTQTQTIIYSIALLLIANCIWNLLNWVWIRPKNLERRLRQQGISGSPYRLFHGDLKDIRKMEFEANATPLPSFSHDYLRRIRPFLHRTLLENGKVCVTWDGPVATVNVGDVEMVKDVLMRNYEFEKSKSNPLVAMLVRGLVSYNGHKWTQQRKLVNPAFHIHKLKVMMPAFYTSCGETVINWEKKISKGENEIDVCADLVALSADSISRAAFGSSFNEGRRIFKLLKEQVDLTARISLSVYFPGRRYLPTEDNKKTRAIEGEIRTLLRKIIDKRIDDKECKDDLLGILMDSSSLDGHVGGKKPNKQKTRMTLEEVIDECKLFYLAGQGTTSTLLTWTIILLASHQDWQAKARNEVQQVFGTELPHYEGLNRLKIVNMILYEVMRLYPLPEIKRKVAKDNTSLGGLTLPKGVALNLMITHIHHDPQVWGDDAKEFKPERFSQGISNASKGVVSFLGFGWGPRNCIGSNFAMIEVKMAMAMILQRFAFQLSPSYVHAPRAFGMPQPQFGAPILFDLL